MYAIRSYYGIFMSGHSKWNNIKRRKAETDGAKAKISSDDHYYSPGKAVAELDLPQTPIELAIREALSCIH